MAKLTETKIRALKPKEKPYKAFDGDGLYLQVTTAGSKLWRFKYRMHGLEKLLALGKYPDVPLALARERTLEARQQVAKSIDPNTRRKAEKLAHADTFEAVARELLDSTKKSLSEKTYDKKLAWFEHHVFPYFGSHPVRTLEAPTILDVLRRVEAKEKNETAHRIRAACGSVFRYAIATGRASRDPAADLRGALSPVVTRNRAAITDPKKVGMLLRHIDSYNGQPATEAALKLAPLLFVRPGELRGAEWSEMHLTGAHPEWRIPAKRMKMEEEHLVPLSTQAVEILKKIQETTGRSQYVFPSIRSSKRPLSNNTINVALRIMGYKREEMTGHGFRAMASTLLNEMGHAPDVIELQLAHVERNQVRAAYNRAKRMAERRTMMQEWADHLDKLRAEASKEG